MVVDLLISYTLHIPSTKTNPNDPDLGDCAVNQKNGTILITTAASQMRGPIGDQERTNRGPIKEKTEKSAKNKYFAPYGN